MSTVKLPGGVEYEVAHFFGDSRALVKYEGLFVLVDRDPQTGEWDLSGEPARNDEEKRIIAELTIPMEDQSIVTVTKEE